MIVCHYSSLVRYEVCTLLLGIRLGMADTWQCSPWGTASASPIAVGLRKRALGACTSYVVVNMTRVQYFIRYPLTPVCKTNLNTTEFVQAGSSHGRSFQVRSHKIVQCINFCLRKPWFCTSRCHSPAVAHLVMTWWKFAENLRTILQIIESVDLPCELAGVKSILNWACQRQSPS